MWNIVLSLCLFTGGGEAPKAVEGRVVAVGRLIRGRALVSSVKKGMTVEEVENRLGYMTGCSGSARVRFDTFEGGVCVVFVLEVVTINGQDERRLIVRDACGTPLSEILKLALTGEPANEPSGP
jgi:hypothetical protein